MSLKKFLEFGHFREITLYYLKKEPEVIPQAQFAVSTSTMQKSRRMVAQSFQQRYIKKYNHVSSLGYFRLNARIKPIGYPRLALCRF